MKDLKHWVDKYTKIFDEQFPLFMLMGIPEEELIQMIQKAIENKEPIEIEHDDETLY